MPNRLGVEVDEEAGVQTGLFQIRDELRLVDGQQTFDEIFRPSAFLA